LSSVCGSAWWSPCCRGSGSKGICLWEKSNSQDQQ
jgi:hypothetical protein